VYRRGPQRRGLRAGNRPPARAKSFQARFGFRPFPEREPLRTEFLGRVSHELRAPLAAIRDSGVTLLEDARVLDAAERHELHRIIVEQTRHCYARCGRNVAPLNARSRRRRPDIGWLGGDDPPADVHRLPQELAGSAYDCARGRRATRKSELRIEILLHRRRGPVPEVPDGDDCPRHTRDEPKSTCWCLPPMAAALTRIRVSD